MSAGAARRTFAWMRDRWPAARPFVVAGFLVAVVAALVLLARRVEWGDVSRAVLEYDTATLALALAVAAAAHLVYTAYDVLAAEHLDHDVPRRQVMGVAFVSYAFNLNLGAIIGAAGFRYRLYSRLGLEKGVIGRIVGFSVLTNWLGYLALAGAIFLVGDLELPASVTVGRDLLRVVGGLMLLAVVGYVVQCARARGRDLRLGSLSVKLPSWRVALLQVGLASLDWMIISLIPYILLDGRVGFVTVLGVQLVGAVAAVVIHIPAGLGVLETVYVAFLQHAVPSSEIIGALLAFRGVYYLAPLLVGLAVYVTFESRGRLAAREA